MTTAHDDLLALIEPTPPAGRQTDVDPDGWIFDINSGEVVGRVDADDQFTINSVSDADFVLELRSRIEGEIAGIDARLAAVTAQLKALRAAQVRRLSWWIWKFEPGLVTFARTLLAGRKERTARFGWGQVAFRTTPGNHRILDDAEAVAWVRIWAPEKVRVVETVSVKDVLATRAAVAAETGDEPDRLPWLAAGGAKESVKVSTGIKLRVDPYSEK